MEKLSNEDRFFMQQEADKRARIRTQFEAAAKADAERASVSERMGITDQVISDRIRALGFDGETAPVLHLLPLVEVAWADGAVTSSERTSILSAAQAHGITPGSPAGLLLASLLEKRPSRTALDQILSVLKDLLHAKGMQPGTVLEACLDVAKAHVRLFGFGDEVNSEEREVINRVTKSFDGEVKKDVADRLQ